MRSDSGEWGNPEFPLTDSGLMQNGGRLGGVAAGGAVPLSGVRTAIAATALI